MGKRFDNEIAGKHLKILGILKSPVNVRDIPINGKVTGSVIPGNVVGVATGNLYEDNDGFTWIQILNNNIKGWVRGDLISEKAVSADPVKNSFLPILLVVGAGWFLFFKKKR